MFQVNVSLIKDQTIHSKTIHRLNLSSLDRKNSVDSFGEVSCQMKMLSFEMRVGSSNVHIVVVFYNWSEWNLCISSNLR